MQTRCYAYGGNSNLIITKKPIFIETLVQLSIMFENIEIISLFEVLF